MKKIFLRINNDYNDKTQLIEEVINEVMASKQETVIKKIIEREKISPTILDINISVPHIIYKYLDTECVIFVMLKNPVYWGKKHAETVNKFFFILTKSREALNNVLTKIAIFVQNTKGNIHEKDFKSLKI